MDHAEALGHLRLRGEPSEDDIRTSFRQLIRQSHPDVAASVDTAASGTQSQLLITAYRIALEQARRPASAGAFATAEEPTVPTDPTARVPAHGCRDRSAASSSSQWVASCSPTRVSRPPRSRRSPRRRTSPSPWCTNTSAARTLAWVEAVIGQFYVAVIVAQLISLNVAASLQKRQSH